MRGLTLKSLRNTFAVLVGCCVLAAAGAARAEAGGSAEDEAAVRANVKQMEAGWNAKSGELFARPFAEDADYVVINGTFIRGRQAIAASHQRIFDTFYKDSTISLSVKQVRFLRPDVAVVHVTGSNKVPEKGETRAVITLVMLREKGAWQIAAFQNTQDTTQERR